MKLIEQIEAILEGIDLCEATHEGGWWETSAGAELGAKKKAEVIAAIRTAVPEATTSEKPEWLIWSNEHRAWWGPDSSGYYHHPIDAGRYTFSRAMTLCKSLSWADRVPPETMIHMEAVVYGLPSMNKERQ